MSSPRCLTHVFALLSIHNRRTQASFPATIGMTGLSGGNGGGGGHHHHHHHQLQLPPGAAGVPPPNPSTRDPPGGAAAGSSGSRPIPADRKRRREEEPLGQRNSAADMRCLPHGSDSRGGQLGLDRRRQPHIERLEYCSEEEAGAAAAGCARSHEPPLVGRATMGLRTCTQLTQAGK